MLGPAADWMETAREHIINYLANVLVRCRSCDGSLYVKTTTDDSEFVGIVDKPEDKIEQDLATMGFNRNPLAAWKTLSGSNHHEEGSWRLDCVDDPPIPLPAEAHPHDEDGCDFQLHVVLYEIDSREGTTAVFAHHELSWTTHPIGHYKGTYVNDSYGSALMNEYLKQLYGAEYDEEVDNTVEVDELLETE